jgi:low affinity Fe/Cu permease
MRLRHSLSMLTATGRECESSDWQSPSRPLPLIIQGMLPMESGFRRLATIASTVVGSMWAFLFAAVAIVAWAAGGFLFGVTETWLLVVNTVGTIITFLMVFLIQNTQNRHSIAIQLKLDELIRGIEGPRTHLVNLESLTDEELRRLQREFRRLRERESEKVSLAHAQRRAGLDREGQ